MEGTESCKYDTDKDIVSVIKSGGSKMSILCAALEESLSTTAKLVWIKENEPSTYEELVITGRLQGFLDQ